MPRAKISTKNPFGLTFREREVLEELIRLGSPKAVAASEGLCTKTVRNLMRSAVQRVGASTPLQAAVLFDREIRKRAAYAGGQPRSVFELAGAQRAAA